ncbi:MAG: hypothetical protein HY738_03570 [Bacteroidia bacterium]|nr:hypothetical protein [Bacteroidia bacterium]
MSTVRKAYPGDFEFIVPLLEKFNNPEFTKERWHRLFKKHWESDEEHIGYVMIDNDIPVGFFVTIFNK